MSDDHLDNLLKLAKSTLETDEEKEAVEEIFENEHVPRGARWLQARVARLASLTGRRGHTRKPEPRGRAALVARQKKARGKV